MEIIKTKGDLEMKKVVIDGVEYREVVDEIGTAGWAWEMWKAGFRPITMITEGRPNAIIQISCDKETFINLYADSTNWRIGELEEQERSYSCLFYEEGARTAVVKYLSTSQIDRIIAIMKEGENA